MKLVSAVLFAVAFLVSAPVFSQTEEAPEAEEQTKEFAHSDEELIAFFDINQQISVVQKETQQKIADAAQGAGLTMDRFNQIARAAQIGAMDQFSEEEITAFNEVAPQVTAIQRELQNQIQATIVDHGISPDKYQQIIADYRSDPELQAYVKELLTERARERIREERDREKEENQEEPGTEQ
ncbi:MAG: DUF4168 domain-containing protein [Bacteroidales bacterium]